MHHPPTLTWPLLFRALSAVGVRGGVGALSAVGAFGGLAAVGALGGCSSSAAAPDAAPPGTNVPDAGPEIPTDDGGPPSADAASPVDGQLGILSLNLHCLKVEGTAFATNEARFAAIASAVASQSVDVVLAQEVCVSATEDARAMLLAALAKATGTTWSSAIALAHRAWEGTADEADEHVAIFSRGSLTGAHETVHRAQGSLRRVTLGATITSRLTSASGSAPLPVRVYTVHLDHATPLARAAQAREAASAAMVESDEAQVAVDAGGGAVALPLVVAGDFNAQSATDTTQALVDFGFVETSGSATTTRIDHVFTHRSAPFAPASAAAMFEGAAAVSDHPGVLVRFAAAAPKPVRLTRIVATGTFALPLSVRGDRAPLSWERGWPAFPRASSGPGPSSVALVTSEMPGSAFAYKFLRQDTDWAAGGNTSGVGETDNTSAPSFP
jgi:endonuclease/exonuclease/phosphatase family metal-dependent hydrolase